MTRAYCGNMRSAIGPFAVDSGLVQRKEGMTTVKIHNTNLGKIIYSTFPVVDGEAARVEGLRLMVWLGQLRRSSWRLSIQRQH
jgi:2-methylaconitate cis-trans-isomerase PrpF